MRDDILDPDDLAKAVKFEAWIKIAPIYYDLIDRKKDIKFHLDDLRKKQFAIDREWAECKAAAKLFGVNLT